MFGVTPLFPELVMTTTRLRVRSMVACAVLAWLLPSIAVAGSDAKDARVARLTAAEPGNTNEPERLNSDAAAAGSARGVATHSRCL